MNNTLSQSFGITVKNDLSFDVPLEQHSLSLPNGLAIDVYICPKTYITGTSISGLASLLNYNKGSLSPFIRNLKGVEQTVIFQAVTLTAGGLQGVEFIPSTSIAIILSKILLSKIQMEVRERAETILQGLTTVGWDLLVLLRKLRLTHCVSKPN